MIAIIDYGMGNLRSVHVIPRPHGEVETLVPPLPAGK